MDTQQQQGTSRTKNRGFASMDEHRQREIARKGGRAAHEKGKAHEFTAEEARAAGRKGGEKVSVNRRHMAEIGRRGGKSSAPRRRPSEQTQNPPDQQRAASHEQAAPAHPHPHMGSGSGGGQPQGQSSTPN